MIEPSKVLTGAPRPIRLSIPGEVLQDFRAAGRIRASDPRMRSPLLPLVIRVARRT